MKVKNQPYLTSCPYCGGKAVAFFTTSMSGDLFSIECVDSTGKCEMMPSTDNFVYLNECVEVWNKRDGRAPPIVLLTEINRLKTEIRESNARIDEAVAVEREACLEITQHELAAMQIARAMLVNKSPTVIETLDKIETLYKRIMTKIRARTIATADDQGGG